MVRVLFSYNFGFRVPIPQRTISKYRNVIWIFNKKNK